ncbi:MAG: YidH family protein [Sulfuriferula sp.]
MSETKDPRSFFAAERTLLAWSRTSLTMMAFGFVVERFGIFLHMLAPQSQASMTRGTSFWLGLSFILLGAVLAVLSVIQYKKIFATFEPTEIPDGYWVNLSVFATLVLALLGFAMATYLIIDLK